MKETEGGIDAKQHRDLCVALATAAATTTTTSTTATAGTTTTTTTTTDGIKSSLRQKREISLIWNNMI